VWVVEEEEEEEEDEDGGKVNLEDASKFIKWRTSFNGSHQIKGERDVVRAAKWSS